jgi:hypothetical protein
MTTTITTRRDLRNWVDSATTNWEDRADADVDALVVAILGREDCPRYGQSWTDFLESLPDLADLLG